MTLTVSDQEFAAVSALPPAERYAHFVKRAVDTEEVWTLRGQEGWVLAGDPARELIPVWPHPRYAAACASGEWEGAEPTRIALDDWLAAWLPGIERDERAVAVFPVPDGPGALAEPARLRGDLLRELEQYE